MEISKRIIPQVICLLQLCYKYHKNNLKHLSTTEQGISTSVNQNNWSLNKAPSLVHYKIDIYFIHASLYVCLREVFLWFYRFKVPLHTSYFQTFRTQMIHIFAPSFERRTNLICSISAKQGKITPEFKPLFVAIIPVAYQYNRFYRLRCTYRLTCFNLKRQN